MTPIAFSEWPTQNSLLYPDSQYIAYHYTSIPQQYKYVNTEPLSLMNTC